ncbi:MAG: diaminopimelate epimerase [Prevotella sp.]
MTTKIPFTKMHGAGNDYIYVNTLLYNIPDPVKTSEVWSDRHKGIGSDGLVLIGKPEAVGATEREADYSMRIFNADGSEAMMCGNASRCIGKYLYEKGLMRKETIRLATRSGVKLLKLRLDSEKKTVEAVTVDMLEPRTDVPQQYTGDSPADRETEMWREMGASQGQFVSMGNPHYVIFVDKVEGLDIARYGRKLETDRAFPERCNIEFAEFRPDGIIRTRVWERGSGITMACGTGACATAVAAALTGRSSRHSVVAMDGGDLDILWDDHNHVQMTGPAAFVFEGEACLP